MAEQENRAVTLLKAARDLLMKQNETPYVLNMLEQTVHYDDADCDGSCLIDDIKAYLEDIGEADEEPFGGKPSDGYVFFKDIPIGSRFRIGPSCVYEKIDAHTARRNTVCIDTGLITEFYAHSQVRPISDIVEEKTQ